jgi:hypothetical protein
MMAGTKAAVLVDQTAGVMAALTAGELVDH